MFELEKMVPSKHPLRAIKKGVDQELSRMRSKFDAAYAQAGRPSIPPEQLIKATLLQALYTIRSERQLCEQIRYNMLYRWFLDMSPEDKVWDHSSFTHNRDRFAEHNLMAEFFSGSVTRAIQEEAVSQEHFSVDGTLIDSWASMKSLRRKDQKDDDKDGGDGGSNSWVDWQGEKRGNETHQSKTDPEARLARKGPGHQSKLRHALHLMMENRHGLVMELECTVADGKAERDAALKMARRMKRRRKLKPRTLGADKGYGEGAFLNVLETQLGLEPHIPPLAVPKVVKDQETQARWMAHMRREEEGYQISRRCRMRIEEVIGWIKTVAGLHKARFVGRWKIRDYAYVAAATWNLIRLAKLETIK